MLLRRVRDLLRRSDLCSMEQHAPETGAIAAQATSEPAPACRSSRWPPERLAVADALWGEGFCFPGGEDEILRLARPLGLSGASSVLLLGGGSGGAVRAVAAAFGAWVSGFETDADQVAAGARRCAAAGLSRRAQIELWHPTSTMLPPSHYHHALGLEPLRHGEVERVLAGLAQAVKPQGQLVMTEVVLAAAAPASRLGAWLRAEDRARPAPAAAIGRALGMLGFDIHVNEDMTDRHLRHMLLGWRNFVTQMGTTRPTPAQAAQIVREAEPWLLRAQLMRSGAIRLMRWHAHNRRSS